jgi:hypothetical protein
VTHSGRCSLLDHSRLVQAPFSARVARHGLKVKGRLFQPPCGGLLVASLLLHFPAASSLEQCHQLRTINREGTVGRLNQAAAR